MAIVFPYAIDMYFGQRYICAGRSVEFHNSSCLPFTTNVQQGRIETVYNNECSILI